MKRLALCALTLIACTDPQAPGDQSDGDGDDTDTASTCVEAWQDVRASVTAPPRPSDVALTFDISYAQVGSSIELVLDGVRGTGVAQSTDGPFSTETHSGSWAELRDADDNVLYQRTVYMLFPEALEAPTEDGGFEQLPQCPDDSSVRLSNFPNLAGATQLVLFNEVVDGEPGGPTVEIARFDLP
jgi:hypothetical protein